jgi:sugar phosphate isomerase/epimerase
MKMESRRTFLTRFGTVAAASCLLGDTSLPTFADPLPMPIGFQGYDARFLLIQDWDRGWQQMRDMGYQAVDLVSFHGYGFEKSTVSNRTAKETRLKLASIGMSYENCQFSFDELHTGLDQTLDFCRELRLKNVICAPESKHREKADDWRWQADELNKLGARLKREGFGLGYHNHDVEFLDVDGVTPYDILMTETDPQLVSFQIDVGNLSFAGKDAIHYLKKYSARYFSMHAKDYKPGMTSVPVGMGILDWKAIFTLAKATPIQSYYAEVAAYGIGTLHGRAASAWPTDSVDQLRQSYRYLHGLTV